jgi:membrane-anchored protein YejM (alkaline phosphatase superfamily)
MVASKLLVIDPNNAKLSEDYSPIVSIKTFFNEYFVYNYDNSYKYQPMTTDMDQWPLEVPNILQL